MNALKYTRTLSLTSEATQILCTGKDNIRIRLQNIDREFFLLSPTEFPGENDIQILVGELHKAVFKLKPTGDEGTLEATFTRSRFSTLEQIAGLIWKLNSELTNIKNSQPARGPYAENRTIFVPNEQGSAGHT